jgi:iduronate 2-sulfatase
LNVLFIAVDDMRVELGCYGHQQVISPNIDGLASRGTLFERAYCQQAVCNPSRASLLTGLRPQTLGIWDLPTHFRQVRPDVVTLPQLFKDNGYFAQDVGKIFHNWRQDVYQGDPVSWSVPAEMHYASHGTDAPQVEEPIPPDLVNVPRCEMRDVPDDAYFDGRVAKRAVEVLRERKQAGTPFFLAVGFWKPHAQFNAPKQYWDMYDPATIQPPAYPDPPRNVPSLALHDSREILRGFTARPNGRPTAEEVLVLRRGYLAAISYVDAQIGVVLDELDRLDLQSNTIIVFWSDHGFHLGEHGLWAKTSNFELDAHVPMIISLPGQTQPQRSNAVVELIDIYPTLTDLCGLSASKELEGESLKPILEDPETKTKGGAWTWHPRPAYPAEGDQPQAMGYSLRTARFRFTQWRDMASEEVLAQELYDHRVDPHETNNLVDDPLYSQQVQQLSARVLRQTKKAGSENPTRS